MASKARHCHGLNHTFQIRLNPLGDIIWKHKLEFELYAHDDQLYLVFKSNLVDSALARERVETYISELREWMAINFLMLNDDKTVFLVIGSHFKDPPHLSNLTIGSTEITKSNSARNLGVIFDQGMAMEEHISYVVKTTFFHNIGVTRKYLTQQATETLVHAYIYHQDWSTVIHCFMVCPNILFKD